MYHTVIGGPSKVMRTYGLIPAAGKSARMGRPKLLLPVGGQTVLARVLTAVRAGGVAEVLVVVGPDAGALAAAAARAGADALVLGADTADMRQTCLHGLDWLERHRQPQPGDGWLLLPADHPTTQPALVGAAGGGGAASRAVDCRAGVCGQARPSGLAALGTRRSDPRLPAGEALNAFIRGRAAETLELPWVDAGILCDLDTPEDYRRLLGETDHAAG